MQTPIHPLLTALLAALPGLGPAAPKIASQTLEELVRNSDRIVIGRVEAVVAVPLDEKVQLDKAAPRDEVGNRAASGSTEQSWTRGRTNVPVALLAVERTLLGPPAERVSYLACGTWTCDISKAEVGERVLLFLQDTRWMSGERAAFHAQLAQVATQGTGSAPAFQLSLAGRGSMPLREIEGRSYATVWTGDVLLPDSISTIDGPEPLYGFIRSVPLDALTERVEQVVARAFPRLSASLQPEGRNAQRYRISVWADGRAQVYRTKGNTYELGWRRCEDDCVRALLDAGRTIAASADLPALRPDPYVREVRELNWLERDAAWRLQGSLLDSEALHAPRHGANLALVEEVRRAWMHLASEAELPLDEE